MSQPDRLSLEAHLRTNPDDWSAWLVYADWLTEQGDIRGQMIVWEHALTRPERATEHDMLKQRLYRTMLAHQPTWSAGLPELYDLNWRSGFVSRATVESVETALLVARHPVARLLVELSLSYIGTADAMVLAQSPSLRSLPSLKLIRCHIRSEGLDALASSENLRSLAALDLYGNDIGDEGAQLLARSTRLPALTELRLGSNHIHAAGAQALALSESLRCLDLSQNDLRDEGAHWLARSAGALEQLDLRDNNIYAAGARALARSETLGALRRLDLRDNRIGADGAADLARSAVLGGLDVLHLRERDVGAEGRRALEVSTTLRPGVIRWS